MKDSDDAHSSFVEAWNINVLKAFHPPTDSFLSWSLLWLHVGPFHHRQACIASEWWQLKTTANHVKAREKDFKYTHMHTQISINKHTLLGRVGREASEHSKATCIDH